MRRVAWRCPIDWRRRRLIWVVRGRAIHGLPYLSRRENYRDAAAVSLTLLREEYADRWTASNDAAALAEKASETGRRKLINFADG